MQGASAFGTGAGPWPRRLDSPTRVPPASNMRSCPGRGAGDAGLGSAPGNRVGAAIALVKIWRTTRCSDTGRPGARPPATAPAARPAPPASPPGHGRRALSGPPGCPPAPSQRTRRRAQYPQAALVASSWEPQGRRRTALQRVESFALTCRRNRSRLVRDRRCARDPWPTQPSKGQFP